MRLVLFLRAECIYTNWSNPYSKYAYRFARDWVKSGKIIILKKNLGKELVFSNCQVADRVTCCRRVFSAEL